MQHLPQPRATSAAWLVMPPRAVRMPDAARIPSTSSGLVSSRTRITVLPTLAQATASAAVNTTWPTAPPGPAGSPLASSVASSSAFGSTMGCSNSSNCAGCTRMTAVFSSIILDRSMSMAILRAAVPVRFPVRVCKRYSTPSWIVNSRSCMSR